MCGRFALNSTPQRIALHFGLAAVPDLVPRYNIAPSQSIVTIREDAQGSRELAMARWGLIPAWSKEPKTGYSTINARAETVASKPAFRSAFRHRRCLIPADGYYEWSAIPGSKLKQPHYIGLQTTDAPFAFAGLWEVWIGADGQRLESCTIIVTDANDLTRPIHDRMPVILPPEAYAEWLSPATNRLAELQALLKPFPSGTMQTHPVGLAVNNPRNDGSELIQSQELGNFAGT